jgi:hypothetical protein
MDLFDQLENIKNLEVVYGPPMQRLFDGFGRHGNVYNLGRYVPDVVCPVFCDESKTTYEVKDPVVMKIHGKRKIYINTRNNSGVYRIID